METKPKIGLIGSGRWGKNYVRNLAVLGVLGAVCDQDQASLDWVSSQYPQVWTTTSVDELAARAEIAGVVVATPTPTHAPIASQLLAAGKHCHVEKPLTDSPESARELLELSNQRNLTLMVGHILLYHPVVEYIKGMIDNGDLGEIYYICAQRANLGQIRRNENAMWSLAPHDISVVQYLLGADPHSVSATGRAFVQTDEQIHDITHLTLHYNGRQFATITSSWLDPEKVRLIKVVGSERMVVFDDMDPRYKLQVHEKSVDWEQFSEPVAGSSLKVRSGDVSIPFVKPTEPLRAECEEFIRCIETGATPRANGSQGYANVRILACADESLRQEGMPVATNL
ncbi:Gfo/Idh/MocA family oxidoreductase [bacterium]|nr:Gfo/Idh/MocA family oxidoreductase [bacterium]